MTDSRHAPGSLTKHKGPVVAIGVALSAVIAVIILRLSLLTWLSTVNDSLTVFGPPFCAILLIAPVGLIARRSDLQDCTFLREQRVVAGLLDSKVTLIVFSAVLLCQYFTYYGRSAEHKRIVVALSVTIILTLLWHLGHTVFSFCQSRPRGSTDSGGSRALADAQIQSIRNMRGRFAYCILLYYVASILAVATVFADFYYSAMAVDLGASQVARLGDDVRLTVSGAGVVVDRSDAIRLLTSLMAEHRGAITVEASVPGALGYQARERFRDTLRVVVAEAQALAHGSVDAKGIVLRHEHNSDTNGPNAFASMLHVQDVRQPFVNSSESYYDAFYMSALTLVSMGLTDNYPVSDTMKFVVLLEEFVGVFFFIVFLGSMVTALSD